MLLNPDMHSSQILTSSAVSSLYVTFFVFSMFQLPSYQGEPSLQTTTLFIDPQSPAVIYRYKVRHSDQLQYETRVMGPPIQFWESMRTAKSVFSLIKFNMRVLRKIA